jgi:O-antigen ligase/thioredoxin-like negative regulator of GroEL
MTKHNIWSISIISLLFVLLFTPLIVATGLYFPYITGKVFAFRIITSIILVFWLILVLKKPEFLPKKSFIIGVSGIFILWLIISNSFGVDPRNSFFSNFERMEGWFTHLYFFIYLLVVSSVLKTEQVWNWFLNTSVVVANIIALRAAFDSQSRTQVILGNSTYVAIYALFNLFFAALLFYRTAKKKTKEDALKYFALIYYVSSIILFAYVIFRTQTRGTVLALLFSSILFLVLMALSYWKNKKVRIISVALILISIGGSLLFWNNRDAAFIQNNPLLSRIATISASEGTGKARLVNWGIALEGIKENPILGWGQENYTYVFAQKYDPRMYDQEPWFDRTHNMFLDWSIQGGVPAAALYILIFVMAVIGIKKSTSLTRVEKNILISLLVAYAIHNMFVFDNYSSYLMFFTLLGFVIYHSQKQNFEINWDKKVQQVVAIVLIAVVLVVSFFTIVKPFTVARDLIKVILEKDQNKALSRYESILKKNTFGTTESGIRIMSSVRPFLEGSDPEIAKQYLAITTQFGEKFAQTNDVRRLETYGTFLLQTGNIQEAVEVLEKAQTLAPDRQNNLYTLAIAYINNKEINKAKEVFQHAYEVLPENQKAKNYYGAALLMTGDKNYAQYLEGYSYKDPLFMSIFAQAKQYKEVIKIREQMKKDNPTDYQNQVSLAVAYSMDRQPVKAIAILREVQKALPEFKAQGEYLIKEIQAGRSLVK